MDRHSSNDSDDDNTTDITEQPSIVERFLSSLFEDRLLAESPAASATTPPSPLQPALVPFFSADSILATPQRSNDEHAADSTTDSAAHIAPAAPSMQRPHHVVFCVEDTVGLKDDKYSVGVVERSFGDVDSHEPRPQRDYGEDIERDVDISREEFAKFMKSGIPPRGSVLVSWQTQLKTELVSEAKLQLLDRALRGRRGQATSRRAHERDRHRHARGLHPLPHHPLQRRPDHTGHQRRPFNTERAR
jgi:ubiquitin-conjugating enzyme E2 O